MRLLHYSDIENAHDDPERIGRLAGLIDALGDDETVVCGTGDNLAPGVLPLVTRGGIALKFYDAVRPDLSTFGNHDFDFGTDRLAEIVDRSPQTWLTANVLDGETPFAGAAPWTIQDFGDARVGFVAVTDRSAANAHPDANGLTFADPIAATDQAIESMGGVDHVVDVSHLGRGDDRLAVACDVDVVLGGHVHSERVARVADTLLVRPGSGGETLLEIELPTRSVTRHDVDDGPLDPDLAASYRSRLNDAGLDEVVGTVADPIRRTEREAFRGESRVGNFVADAYRWAAERATGETAIGLQNSGGIRTGPALSEEVTVADLVSLVPFREPLVVLELTGEELLETVREAADTTGFGEEDWWHGHVSGLRLVYDHDDDVLVDCYVDGDPVDPRASYWLATTEFLLGTDEEFPTLSGVEPAYTLDVQYELLAAYARDVGIDPKLENRIVRNGLGDQ